MSSIPRKRSESNIYHVFSRGSGRQIIFEDDEDRLSFLRILENRMRDCPCRVFAYCLMDNHYHLVMGIEFKSLSRFMHGLNWKYARYYNERHESSGHLFESRFCSQAVDDDEYFLQAIRYVHRNPVEARLCRSCEYPWSSYADYLESSGLTSTGKVLDMFGSRDAFEAFHRHSGKESFVDDSVPIGRIDAETALKRARQALGETRLQELKSLNKPERDEYLALLRSKGISTSQIARMTGISRPTVSRATKAE